MFLQLRNVVALCINSIPDKSPDFTHVNFYFHFMFLQLRSVVASCINPTPDQRPDITYVYNIAQMMYDHYSQPALNPSPVDPIQQQQLQLQLQQQQQIQQQLPQQQLSQQQIEQQKQMA